MIPKNDVEGIDIDDTKNIKQEINKYQPYTYPNLFKILNGLKGFLNKKHIPSDDPQE